MYLYISLMGLVHDGYPCYSPNWRNGFIRLYECHGGYVALSLSERERKSWAKQVVEAARYTKHKRIL
jgi:hypothetical protein